MAHYWIIGASEGIGEALAKELDKQGHSTTLSARNEVKLQTLATKLKHAEVLPLDITNQADVKKAAETLKDSNKLVNIIHLAALYEPMHIDDMNIEDVERIIHTNLTSTFYIVHNTFKHLKEQGYGQLALCGSVAGLQGLPYGQPYSASKAGLINLAESLYLEAQGTGVDIKLINPGFVRSRLTDKNTFTMPLIQEPEDAAKSIIKGLSKGGFHIHFPKGFTIPFILLSKLPSFCFKWIKN